MILGEEARGLGYCRFSSSIFFNGSLRHNDVLFLYFLKVKPLAVFFTEKIFNDRFLRSF